jgi:hypothetical protein
LPLHLEQVLCMSFVPWQCTHFAIRGNGDGSIFSEVALIVMVLKCGLSETLTVS